MTFGWHGFRIDHPDDWSPAHLTGSRKEGYARIASPHRLSLQIRWRETASPNLDAILDAYFSGLDRENRKRKHSFSSEREEGNGELLYRWLGAEQGRGAVFHRSGETGKGRLFFVEVTGGKKDSLLPKLRSALESFSEPNEELELWSVLGLAVRLPRRWSLRRHTFQAGKTTLDFEQRGANLECVRWGFAEQLLRQHGFEDWARAALDMSKAACVADQNGLTLSHARLGRSVEAVAALQEDRNQIVTMKLTRMRGAAKPEWDWLAY